VSQDQDELTLQNEYVTHVYTLGFAIHPPRTTWTMEGGYGIGSLASDFGDPARTRGSAQQGVFRLRWAF